MINITVDPKVEAALQAAFPESNAARSLAKYVGLLEQLIFDALSRGQAPIERKLGLYAISTKRLRDQGGQIGKGKIRIHKWLSDNKLALVQNVDPGSNLTGKLSLVKLTDLVEMQDDMKHAADKLDSIMSDRQLDAFLSGNDESNAELVAHLFPGIKQYETRTELLEDFDVTPVDTASLKSYLYWLEERSNKLGADKKQLYIRQARIILAVAQQTDGKFLQRKKLSPFGRTYYFGLSVQNVNKELRRAMLGNCWEYDIRSSVIAWKMGFAAAYMETHEPTGDLRRTFSSTLCYLEDKADFIHTLRYFTFDQECGLLDPALQLKVLKQALTAISFGARLTTCGWKCDSDWKNPALVDIIKNQDNRQRFLNCAVTHGFVREQNLLDNFIFELAKQCRPDLLSNSLLTTAGGRLSKSKVVAYLYQHAETEVMQIATEVAMAAGNCPIAKIHDAMIFAKPLGYDLMQEVESAMQQKTGNPYWHLAVTTLKRYEPPPSLDAQQAILEHKSRIAEEEARARALYN